MLYNTDLPLEECGDNGTTYRPVFSPYPSGKTRNFPIVAVDPRMRTQ